MALVWKQYEMQTVPVSVTNTGVSSVYRATE